MLVLDRVCKKFGGVTAVKDCSLSIEEGSITGLIGPNGAGKTTTFNVIAGAIAPTSGKISFADNDITGLPAHRLFHKGIARTFQIPHEFKGMTVLENLMVVPPSQPGESLLTAWFRPGAVDCQERVVRQKAEETLEFLNLAPLRDLPAGSLSGGQKKLLEIGRTIMADPRLVLLDEPGAGVNPTFIRTICEMITRLRRERNYTFCIIEHDMDMIAQICDTVIVMVDGSVFMEGRMEEIRRNPAVLDAYLGAHG